MKIKKVFLMNRHRIFPTMVSVVTGIFLVVASVNGQETVAKIRHGRNIQLDGFLIDWVKKERKEWASYPAWQWDAVSTKEGVAGYFLAPPAACSTWSFSFYRGGIHSSPMALSTGSSEGQFFRVNRDKLDGQSEGRLTIEWLIPWDSLTVGDDGGFSLAISGRSGCGDSLKTLPIAGNRDLPKQRPERRVLFQAGIILALLVWYILLQKRIRRRTRRKE
jgi:hypothetical protein